LIRIIDHIKTIPSDLPTVHILHGIHRDNPETGPGNWAKYFNDAGFNVKVWDYGKVYALTARFFVNPDVVERLLKVVKPGDILLGHSNGCAIIADAVDSFVFPAGVVLLNPALNVDRFIDAPFVHVYCNKDDIAVAAGKWYRRLNPVSWFFRHPYGEQGRYGPSFIDSSYQVFKGEKPPQDDMPPVSGHSHINDPEILKSWGAFGVRQVLNALK